MLPPPTRQWFRSRSCFPKTDGGRIAALRGSGCSGGPHSIPAAPGFTEAGRSTKFRGKERNRFPPLENLLLVAGKVVFFALLEPWADAEP
ncbi:hypothetical protein Nepgr_029033 [Nepenthes gracilis]|uniref:Uncharacterized protein n=1 Tax=Nepenthes gracilis TaxID=150966 RepID=A0AAD3TCU8_NEPGR|nr:hypothetical protein Nepgr_029033 [Nepenthes gracilis]